MFFILSNIFLNCSYCVKYVVVSHNFGFFPLMTNDVGVLFMYFSHLIIFFREMFARGMFVSVLYTHTLHIQFFSLLAILLIKWSLYIVVRYSTTEFHPFASTHFYIGLSFYCVCNGSLYSMFEI